MLVSQLLLTRSLMNGIVHCKHEIIFIIVKINLFATVCFGEELNLKREVKTSDLETCKISDAERCLCEDSC